MLNKNNKTMTHESTLYNNIVLLARNKIFYTKFKLKDTFQNRIHLIFIHVSFLFIKIKQKNDTDIYKTIPKAKKKCLKVKISYEGPISAPINKNEVVGKLTIFFKDENIGNYDLLASENIKKQNIFSRFINSINYLLWGDV